MYARVRELLTPEERLQYLQIPPDLGEWELGTYFTFTQHDLEIIQQRRRDYNRIGFAVQLCVLRYIGWTLSDVKEVPVQVLRYIAKQIYADTESFASYGGTRSHEIRAFGGNKEGIWLPDVYLESVSFIVQASF